MFAGAIKNKTDNISNRINYSAFIVYIFGDDFIARAKALLKLIEKAMGIYIADRSSEQTVGKR